MLWNTLDAKPNVIWNDCPVPKLIKLPLTETKLNRPFNHSTRYEYHITSMPLHKNDDERMRGGTVSIELMLKEIEVMTNEVLELLRGSEP
jgi:hypothetical protein